MKAGCDRTLIGRTRSMTLTADSARNMYVGLGGLVYHFSDATDNKVT